MTRPVWLASGTTLLLFACTAPPAAPPDAGDAPDASTPADGPDAGPTVEVATVEVIVDPELICLGGCQTFKVAETRQFVAIVRDAAGTELAGVPVTWRSADAAVATVDAAGLARGTGVGETELVAEAGGVSGTILVFVDPARVARIEVSPATGSLAVAATLPFTARAWDDEGTELHDVVFDWSSSNPSVATVDSAGLLTGVAPGHVIVTASSVRGFGSDGWSSVRVEGVSDRPVLTAAGIASGGAHACAFDAAGAAACWGWDFFGQHGTGSFGGEQARFPYPRLVAGTQLWSDLALGLYHSCGLTDAGEGWCWGGGSSGELGVFESVEPGQPNTVNVPMPVLGGLTFAKLAAGGSHTCGLDTDGFASCWGAGYAGQLGNGATLLRQPLPAPVDGGRRFVAITAGLDATCALDAEGRAFCWGGNSNGQIGSGAEARDGNAVLEPVEVALADGVRLVQLDLKSNHACGVTAAGEAWCWGRNDLGQIDATGEDVRSPQRITATVAFRHVATGAFHTCAIDPDGAAWCWGNNHNAQLGDESLTSSVAPVRVSGGLAFQSLAAGPNHTCGLTTTNTVWCWGTSYTGELGSGQGGETSFSAVPVPVVPVAEPAP